MKIKARAHSNIALVKYWGKKNIDLNLPAVASISITLDALFTETSMGFSRSLLADELILNGRPASEKETKRVSAFLDLLRVKAGKSDFARVDSKNNFPTTAGLASSASSFACLALAGSKALGLDLEQRELSVLARMGSGSAARSLYGGFVEMKLGEDGDGSDSFAFQLFPPRHWNLKVFIVVTSQKKKKTGSTDGMELSRKTSPYYKGWVDSSFADIDEMREAITRRDFEKVADISEFSCLKMHALAMASRPGLIYWNGTTVELIHIVRKMRQNNIPAFFTIDAGPQVKVICPGEYTQKVSSAISSVPGVVEVIETGLGGDAQILGEDA